MPGRFEVFPSGIYFVMLAAQMNMKVIYVHWRPPSLEQSLVTMTTKVSRAERSCLVGSCRIGFRSVQLLTSNNL